MKKIILILCMASLICACNSNEPNEQNLTREQIEQRMFERLSALKQKYQHQTFPDNNSEKHLLKTSNENSEFSSDEKCRIAKADAWGAIEGAAMGASIGGAVGTVVPSIGNGAGAIGGGVSLAAVYAVRRSKEEADAIREEHNNNAMAFDDIYKLNTLHPINDFTFANHLFNDGIRFANIGFMHNYIISSIYNEVHEDFFDMSDEDLAANIFEDYFTPLSAHEQEYYNLFNHVTMDFNLGLANAFTLSNSDTIIQFYFEELADIPENSWCEYTEDFMQIVDQNLGELDEDRVLLINGCLSTFFYSKCLWNLNVPDNYSGKYVVFNITTGTWQYIECSQPALDQLLISNYGNILVFIPHLNSEGDVTNLFLMDYNNSSQLTGLNNNPYIVGANETTSLIITPNNQFFYESIDSNSPMHILISAGVYALQRFNEGYFLTL